MLGSFITALRTLTIIPLGGKEAEDLSDALPFFPIVGLIIGGIGWLIAVGVEYINGDFPLLTGLIITVISLTITGCLHLDGLADVADGFGGGGTKERILELLKDPRHGTFGVTAIVFDSALRVICISRCLEIKHLELIVLSPILARTVIAWACLLLPYARISGGTASPFISNRHPVPLFLFSAGIGGVCLLLFGYMPLGTVSLISLIPVQFFFFFCLNKIDGITGDCLGAANEIAEISFLITACLAYNHFDVSGG